MLDRRKFLGSVGAAAAGVAAAKLATSSDSRKGASPGDAVERARSNPLADAGVGPGAGFGTCTVAHVVQTDEGAVGVSLVDADGVAFELEVLGHDARTPGVARAGSLAVYVNNRGRGDTRTNEAHGLAAMALAAQLAQHEAAGGALPNLPTLAERSRRTRLV